MYIFTAVSHTLCFDSELVPSSARSSASAAMPLPPQLVPLLSDTLEKVKSVIARVLPVEKRLTALEEAEFEDFDGEEGALEREMTMQCMCLFIKQNVGLMYMCSDGDAPRISTTGDTAWCGRNGTILRGCSSPASSRGLSRSKS